MRAILLGMLEVEVATTTTTRNGRATKTSADGDASLLALEPLSVKTVRMRIIGDSPLMTHQWSHKAVKMIEDAQQQEEKTGKRPPKNPLDEFEASVYRLPDGTPGIPARAFKKAVTLAVTHVDGMTKTFVRTAFHCLGDAVGVTNGRNGEMRPTDLVRIEGPDPEMRTDMVKVGGISRSADVRYRPEWGWWSCWVTVKYNARSISVKQLIHLFNLAGFGVGVGEWRPEKDGMHGLFHVTEVEEVD